MHPPVRSAHHVLAVALALSAGAWASPSFADVVTDWNEHAVRATKGFNGTASSGVTPLDSNLSSRILAIEARAVFDAVNAIEHFSPRSYYYNAAHTGSPDAAAAQAAHDVLAAQLPNPAVDATVDARWAQTQAWLDSKLAESLAALGASPSGDDIAAGKAAAAAANLARSIDGAAPVTTYGAQLAPATNPGVGLWRQSNAAATGIDPTTGAPTGFDAAGVIQGRPGVDLNWRDVSLFSLSNARKSLLVANVPLSPAVGSREYLRELAYVRAHGRNAASSAERSADETAQALFYKQDAEIFVNEAARIASQARHLGLVDNARLFALLDSVVADARIAAFTSKYDQKFWRPITALNADEHGAVTNNYAAWRPLAATPSHPSNTAGHSATGAAGFEVLRALFGDRIVPSGAPVTLTSLPWLVGSNAGTGNATTRTVSTFTQVQLENGASRLYLGVHFGFDNLQGQLLGLAVADEIIRSGDPAAAGVHVTSSPASLFQIEHTLVSQPRLYGYFGDATEAPDAR
jgi:hypothetical protein